MTWTCQLLLGDLSICAKGVRPRNSTIDPFYYPLWHLWHTALWNTIFILSHFILFIREKVIPYFVTIAILGEYFNEFFSIRLSWSLWIGMTKKLFRTKNYYMLIIFHWKVSALLCDHKFYSVCSSLRCSGFDVLLTWRGHCFCQFADRTLTTVIWLRLWKFQKE